MLRIEKKKKKKKQQQKKKKKKKKKIWLQPGSNRERPHWESNVTTTAPAHYVFKIESSFYIITYSS